MLQFIESFINMEPIKLERNKKNINISSFFSIKLIYIFLFLFLIIRFYFTYYDEIVNKMEHYIKKRKYRHELKTSNFSILSRLECPQCGFFSFYIVHLGCIYRYLLSGYTPIIDLKSFPNVYNGNDTSKDNPWELFFHQPFNFTLKDVKKYGKHVTNFECTAIGERPDEINMYYNKDSINFWHDFAKKYMPLKNELNLEANKIMKELFGDSTNILGVKMRGTDYIAWKPKGHSIPPSVEQVIIDVKKMDKQYNYDFIFFATEDEIIKKKFIPHFKNKIKLLNPNIQINYDYKQQNFINLNKNINGNIEYIKNYVLNTIILSKCLDIVTPRCSGTAGIFILTNGFRHTKIYNLGEY